MNNTIEQQSLTPNPCTLAIRQSSADGVIFFLIIGFIAVGVLAMMGNLND